MLKYKKKLKYNVMNEPNVKKNEKYNWWYPFHEEAKRRDSSLEFDDFKPWSKIGDYKCYTH